MSTPRANRNTFKKLTTLCDNMEKAIESSDYDAMSVAWDKANAITTSVYMSSYENAISFAFDEFDTYMNQCDYMAEHRDEWSFDRFRIEQRDREKYAHATCAQQDLIRRIYDTDEETVHDDLVLWRRYIDLFHKVAWLNVKRSA